MSNTARKGNAAEVFVARNLKDKGFVVASRRHIGGAGDLLAVRPDGKVWLVEVKACKSLWGNFTRADRQEMRETQLPEGAERWVANVRGTGEKRTISWCAESEWP
jgi:Holliday junction resolvase-like predicted endonuclease